MTKFKEKTKNYQLIISAKPESKEKINERELEYFSQKKLRGLFNVKLIKKLGKAYIEYTAPIGITLRNRCKNPLTEYDFLFIMEQIVDIVQKLQKNSLDFSKVVWDMDHVYMNEMTREIQFIYLPYEQIKTQYSLIEFINNIIYSINTGCEDYLSDFVYFINNMNPFSVDGIEQYIMSKNNKVVHTIKKYYPGTSGFITDKPQEYIKHYCQNEDEMDTSLLDEGKNYGHSSEDETATTLLNESEDETTLLNESYPGGSIVHYPTLYRMSSEENISINKPVFRLGKEKSYSDYFISDNSAVSRSHADIITRKNKYFIIDLNSKNKTYINDQIIPEQQEIELFNGDRIKLANEEFVFFS